MQAPSELAFIALWSRDLAGQRRFFVEVLGHPVRHESNDAIVLEGPAAPLVLHRAGGDTDHLDGSTHFGYTVDDLEGWVAHLGARGARILAPALDVGDGRRAILLQAPGGQSLALVQR